MAGKTLAVPPVYAPVAPLTCTDTVSGPDCWMTGLVMVTPAVSFSAISTDEGETVAGAQANDRFNNPPVGGFSNTTHCLPAGMPLMVTGDAFVSVENSPLKPGPQS